ncbi:MAG: hypothetical protein GX326_02670 [Clostridiaceae bacterium]|nr:hypothetical protein [Clostridiaceae bacterium]
MIIKKIFDEILTENLVLNQVQTAARLKTPKNFSNELIVKCEKQLRQEINCRYSAVLTRVDLGLENQIDLGFEKIQSKSLYKNLLNVNQAYVFAVTLGHSVDRLIQRLKITSLAEYFITDGLASAFTEAACEYIVSEIKEDKTLRPRFSPGYGDLSLEVQAKILELVSAEKLLNIKLNQSFLMSPIKSVTAIVGMEE